ncbi:MAG: hypothetical protein DRN68_08555 [Thaumarchaeota archaeon]|nr:MAG: hypothetical protein DRN68_08555 [Nitrososphaerota archaeon]
MSENIKEMAEDWEALLTGSKRSEVGELREQVAETYLLAYPSKALTKKLPVGTTIINFHQGIALFPDESTEPLMMPIKQDLRSCLFYCDWHILAEFLSMEGKVVYSSYIAPEWQRFSQIQGFRTLRLTAEVPVFVWLAVSTVEDTVPDIKPLIGAYGKPYIYNGLVSTGSTTISDAYANSDEHNIADTLGRRFRTGYIFNESDTASLYVWLSVDGSYTLEEYTRIPPTSTLEITGRFYSVKVGASANDTPYSINVL